MPELIPENQPRDPDQSAQHKTRHDQLLSALSAFVLAVEIPPWTNSAVRLAITGAVGAATRNPEAMGISMLALTAIYEVPGAAATAWLLNTERGGQLTARANELIQTVRKVISGKHIEPEPLQNISPVTAAAVAMVLGPPALLVIKQTIDPSRTMADNMRYGVPVASAVSAALGGETFLFASGVVHPQPEVIGAALIGIAGIAAAIRYGWHQLRHNQPTVHPEDEVLLPPDA